MFIDGFLATHCVAVPAADVFYCFSFHLIPPQAFAERCQVHNVKANGGTFRFAAKFSGGFRRLPISYSCRCFDL